MDIRRDFYLEKLIKRKSNGLIKVITGIRRCGKSYLLNNIFYHHLLDSDVEADHIIRFAFDSADDLYLIGESLIQIEKEKRGVDPEKFMAYIRSKTTGEGIYYLLLDEIQMLERAAESGTWRGAYPSTVTSEENSIPCCGQKTWYHECQHRKPIYEMA